MPNDCPPCATAKIREKLGLNRIRGGVIIACIGVMLAASGWRILFDLYDERQADAAELPRAPVDDGQAARDRRLCDWHERNTEPTARTRFALALHFPFSLLDQRQAADVDERQAVDGWRATPHVFTENLYAGRGLCVCGAAEKNTVRHVQAADVDERQAAPWNGQ